MDAGQPACPRGNSGGGGGVEGITPEFGFVSLLGPLGSLEMPLLAPRCPADADCQRPQPTTPAGGCPAWTRPGDLSWSPWFSLARLPRPALAGPPGGLTHGVPLSYGGPSRVSPREHTCLTQGRRVARGPRLPQALNGSVHASCSAYAPARPPARVTGRTSG